MKIYNNLSSHFETIISPYNISGMVFYIEIALYNLTSIESQCKVMEIVYSELPITDSTLKYFLLPHKKSRVKALIYKRLKESSLKVINWIIDPKLGLVFEVEILKNNIQRQQLIKPVQGRQSLSLRSKSNNRRGSLDNSEDVIISEESIEILEQDPSIPKNPIISSNFLSEWMKESDKYCKQSWMEFLINFLRFKPEMVHKMVQLVMEGSQSPLDDLNKANLQIQFLIEFFEFSFMVKDNEGNDRAIGEEIPESDMLEYFNQFRKIFYPKDKNFWKDTSKFFKTSALIEELFEYFSHQKYNCEDVGKLKNLHIFIIKAYWIKN